MSAGLRSAVGALVAWLDPRDAAAVAEAVAGWGPGAWDAWRRAVVVHGLASHLARGTTGAALGPVLPVDVRAWLAEQDARNTARIDRMHGELGSILDAAARHGIPVMPLKGAVLTTMAGEDPYRRPMADLDLLVRPADRPGMFELLAAHGYRHAPEGAPRPTHDVFTGPEGDRVVAADGEHPDNPRRIELHTEVRRHLWGWVDDDDLTDLLWRDATEGHIVGRPAMLASPSALFVHLAIHASSDLLVGRARLVGWVDLARMAARTRWPDAVPHPRTAYPALALAMRAMPGAMAGLDLRALEAEVPARLVRWAAAVSLDDRCGLSLGRLPDTAPTWAARWERWRPEPWRLAVAYGDAALPVAVARHAAMIVRRGVQRLATRRA